MRNDGWARLAAPFPPEAVDWCVAELDRDRRAARLEPVVAEGFVVRRLDEATGVEGWSKRLLPLGADAVVCELWALDVHRSAVARSFGGVVDMQRVCAWAFGRAAALFGARPPVEGDAWVDFDPEAGEPLYLPATDAAAAPSRAVSGGGDPGGRAQPSAEGAAYLDRGADASPGGAAPPADARAEAQQVIERLLERLKAEGLGREAAALVVEHGGYGRSSEDARELYRKLRELLLQKGTGP